MSDHLPFLMAIIPLLPLVAAVGTAVLGSRLLKQSSHWPVIVALAGSFVASGALLLEVNQHKHTKDDTKTIGWASTHTYWQWATIPDAQQAPAAALDSQGNRLTGNVPFSIGITLRADALTATMLTMVTFISLLVAIFSAGYMAGDPGHVRFFALIGLFVFSMTMLVSSSNFLLLYVFWEAVGACSYLLIGFWYAKPAAADAAKKAFLVNRIGDFGFALGLFLLWVTYGTLNYHDADGIAGILGQTRLAMGETSAYVGGGIGLAICLLLMLGACGKSAQLPLHVWLPDAMEGPTPVSALIHAATMVTAGVYMLVRCTPLFFASVEAQEIVACIGALTALVAGLIAMTQTDLKRVLAYSTVSQLGFMFLSLGTGSVIGVMAGMFHLLTHAFFKALLFLGSGSVMHAMGGVIDMRQFGGLRKLMPITCLTFLIGCLALAGVPPLSGFWSKDMILAAVYERSLDVNPNGFTIGGISLFTLLFWMAVVTAFLTAFYTFRAFFKTFCGEQRVPDAAGHHAHESPASMTGPLVVLALFAAAIGGVLEGTHWLFHFLETTPSLAFAGFQATTQPAFHGSIAATSSVVACLAIGLAAFLYLGKQEWPARIAAMLGPFYRASYGKFFFDELYAILFVWPLRLFAGALYLIDRYLIDGLVNLVGKIPPAVGSILRGFQKGLIQSYALAMVLGLLVLIGLAAYLTDAGGDEVRPPATPTTTVSDP